MLKLVCACYAREEGQFYRQIFDIAGIESILKYRYHTELLHYSTNRKLQIFPIVLFTSYSFYRYV